jgi:FtsZ-binding cell division protein ZapB
MSLPNDSLPNLELTIRNNPIIEALVRGNKIKFLKATRAHLWSDPGLKECKHTADRLFEAFGINDRLSPSHVQSLQEEVDRVRDDREYLKRELAEARKEADNLERVVEDLRDELSKTDIKCDTLLSVIRELAGN